MRYFIDISYNGKNFHGWQIQENASSIQGSLMHALGTYLRHEVNCIGSGRTDTGVHAKQQFVHFDTQIQLDSKCLTNLNAILPKDIAINDIYISPDSASARFDAIDRSYEYYISKKRNPFILDTSYYYPWELDITLMNTAAKQLIGVNDFQCFSKVKTEVNNFNCDIKAAYFVEQEDLITFHITANRFLRGMVRAIVGTLLEIGRNKLTVSDLKKIIESKDRKKAGRAVPPEGLFLSKINYPDFLVRL